VNVQSRGTSGAKLKNTTASFSSLRVHGAAMMVPSTSVGLLGFGWFERRGARSVRPRRGGSIRFRDGTPSRPHE
jgi:hypothetical protein